MGFVDRWFVVGGGDHSVVPVQAFFLRQCTLVCVSHPSGVFNLLGLPLIRKLRVGTMILWSGEFVELGGLGIGRSNVEQVRGV